MGSPPWEVPNSWGFPAQRKVPSWQVSSQMDEPPIGKLRPTIHGLPCGFQLEHWNWHPRCYWWHRFCGESLFQLPVATEHLHFQGEKSIRFHGRMDLHQLWDRPVRFIHHLLWSAFIRSTVAVLQLCNGHRPEAEGSRVATTRNIWVLCRVFPVVCQISCAVVLQITSKWSENVEPLDPYHNFEPTSGRRPWDCFFEIKADKTNECDIDFVVATTHNIQFTPPQDVLFHLIFMMILI